MMSGITVGPLRCEVGQKVADYINAVHRVDDSAFGIPVMIVAGKSDEPVLLVNGRNHGDEHEGPLVITTIARELDPNHMQGIFIGAGDSKGLELAHAMGPDWQIVLDSVRPVGSPMAAMLDRGKTAITVELGESATTMPDTLQGIVNTLRRALINVCRHFDIIEVKAKYASQHWRGNQMVIQATKSSLLEPNPDIPLKKSIQKDELLLHILDLFGETVEELYAPCNGILFGFRAYPAVTASDWALFCADATLEPAELT
jgi:predicted deacylase